jgi:hypothetical protein
MRERLFVPTALAIGMALLATWAATVRGARRADSVYPALLAASVENAELLSALGNRAHLGRPSEITFTPTCTNYLPALFEGYSGCSTIPALLSPVDGSSLSTLAPC